MAAIIGAIYDFLPMLFKWLVVGFVLGLPFLIFTATRPFGVGWLYLLSYGFGFILWFESAVFVWQTWGALIFFLSLIIFGIGPVFLSFIILILHADWSSLGWFLLMACMTFIPRFVAVWMAER